MDKTRRLVAFPKDWVWMCSRCNISALPTWETVDQCGWGQHHSNCPLAYLFWNDLLSRGLLGREIVTWKILDLPLFTVFKVSDGLSRLQTGFAPGTMQCACSLAVQADYPGVGLPGFLGEAAVFKLWCWTCISPFMAHTRVEASLVDDSSLLLPQGSDVNSLVLSSNSPQVSEKGFTSPHVSN